MSKQKKGNSAFWISTIIAFLLAILLTMAGYLGGIYYDLFNKSFLLESVNNASYYNAVMDYSLEHAESLAIPMGLQPEVFDNVFNLDETYAEGNALMQANLDGKEYTPDTSKIFKRLVSNINLYLNQQNIKATTEQQNNITTFASEIADEYAHNLSIPYIKYYANVRTMFSKLIYVGIPVLLALSAFAVFLLIKLHSRLHTALRYITYSTLAASLMTAILPIFLLINGSYKRLNISPEYFYNFVVNYITQSLITFIYVSLALLIISVVMIIAVIFTNQKTTR